MDAQEDSRVALEELVRRRYGKLWQHARRLTSDPQAAWDVTQKSWYDIIKGLPRLDDPACFRARAYNITTLRAMDWLRTRHRRPCSPLSSVGPPCDSDDDSAEVRDALLQLTESSRLVLILFLLTSSTQFHILFATLFLTGVQVIILTKIVYFLAVLRNRTLRDLKRLELSMAETNERRNTEPR